MALNNDINSNWLASGVLDTNGHAALNVRVIAGGAGSPPTNINDLWSQMFVLDANGNVAINVVTSGSESVTTLTVDNLLFNNTTADTRFRRTATKTATFDDAAGGAATLAVTGMITVSDGALGTPGFAFTADTDTGIWRPFGNYIGFTSNSADIATINPNGIELKNAYQFGWVTTHGGAQNLTLGRIAAATLAIASTPSLLDATGQIGDSTHRVKAYFGGGAADTVPLTISGYSVTGSGTSNLASLSGTLNTSGVVDVLKLAITDTAHGTGTKLLNLYGGASGTTSEFSVATDGGVTVNGGITFSTNGSTIAFAGNRPFISFAGENNPAGGIQVQSNVNMTNTTAGSALLGATTTFAPGSGSGSFALLHLYPTINGTSSGTAYGLLLASKTNTLTGGTVKLASFGTTTTDGFTGYTEQFAVSTGGDITTNSGNITSNTGMVLTATGNQIIRLRANGINTLTINSFTDSFFNFKADGSSASFTFAKGTATASAPGAGYAKFEVVCGTNAGTAKLIMYAGTSSTASTVLDNVGSGVTGC